MTGFSVSLTSCYVCGYNLGPRIPQQKAVPQLISEQASKWSKFRRALRREDQLHFDRLIASTRYYSQAGAFQTSDDPRESIVLSMLLDLQKRVAGLEARLKMPESKIPTPEAGELFPASEAPTHTVEVGESDGTE
jgi:hypothetical protein